jgi:hypothetical protein
MPTTYSFPSYNPEFNYLNYIEGRIMEYLSLWASERPKRESVRERKREREREGRIFPRIFKMDVPQ